MKYVDIPKAFWGAAIGGAVNIGMGLLNNAKEKKARKEQEQRQRRLAYTQKFNQDRQIANNFNEMGNDLQSFYAEGGSMKLPPLSTTGGNMEQLSSNVSKAVGNTHEEGGIKISEKGKDVVEVEDQEPIKDNDKVYSNRLSLNGIQSIAEQLEVIQIEKKELEDKLKEKLPRDKYNTIKRKLEIISDKEDKLFEKQEELKQQAEQEAEQEAMAQEAMEQQQGQQGQMPSGQEEMPTEQGQMLQGQGQGMPPQGGQMPMMQPNNPMPQGQMPKMSGGGLMDLVGGERVVGKFHEKFDNKFSPKGEGFDFSNAVPYIDNAANLVNTLTKPKVQKPVYDDNINFNTDYNVASQKNEIQKAEDKVASFVKDNSSNSKSARGAYINARLKGASAKNKLEEQKVNRENQLENRALASNQRINARNNAKTAKYNQDKLGRDLSIRQELSRNVSNAVDDYGNKKKFDAQVQLDEDKNELLSKAYSTDRDGLQTEFKTQDPKWLRKVTEDPNLINLEIKKVTDAGGNPIDGMVGYYNELVKLKKQLKNG